MTTPHNHLKQSLRGTTCQKGIWLTLGNASIAEMIGNAGPDWCLIDFEHGPNTLTTIEAQLRGLESTQASAIVRLPMSQEWLIKQVLDLGAQSLLFPMIHTADQASAAVAACRYPPHGTRGIGATVARASRWGTHADYVYEANDQMCIIVQAESRKSVENIDAIAAVDGVDCVFIGPADLAADLGHIGNPAHPEVQDAIAHLITQTRAAGKAVGLFGTDPSQFAQHEADGVMMLAVGVDSLALHGAIKGLFA